MKAIIDTTILTDATLKTDAQKDRAIAALGRYQETLLPTYAIKEFKAGPLRAYVWLHNKVVEASTMADVIKAISSNIGRRRYLPATALQAIQDFGESVGQQMTDELPRNYPGMSRDKANLIELRLWLRQKITRAWRSREKTFSAVIAPLSCYQMRDHVVKNSGQLDDSPRRCGVADCCLRTKYKARAADIEALENACLGEKPEVVKRRQALRRLRKHPSQPYEEKNCKSLGDAIFSLECRNGAEILTTNVADHAPLAAALGFNAKAP